MRVIAGRVDWMPRWANRPELKLLVDRICGIDEMVFSERDGLCYAELDGDVHFLYDDPSNPQGFGGREFKIRMVDGSERILSGPWSSRAGVANMRGFGPCVDAMLMDDQRQWQKGYTFVAGHCTVEMVRKAKDIIEIGEGCGEFVFPMGSVFTLAEILDGGDLRFDPAVRLPNGSLWVKPGMSEGRPQDAFKEKQNV